MKIVESIKVYRKNITRTLKAICSIKVNGFIITGLEIRYNERGYYIKWPKDQQGQLIVYSPDKRLREQIEDEVLDIFINYPIEQSLIK